MQKRDRKYIWVIILECIALAFIKVSFLNARNINTEISQQEQEEINSFYEIEPDSISRGLNFDMKYVYLDPTALESDDDSLLVANDAIVIEVVMKNKKSFKLDYITITNKNGHEILGENDTPLDKEISLIEEDPTGVFVSLSNENEQVKYKRLGDLRRPLGELWIVINYFKNILDLSELRINFYEKESDLQLFYTRDSNYIVYDEEKRFESTKNIKEKCMIEECNGYEKRHVRYYFGILFRKDFEQWYREIKEFISTVDQPKDYDLTTSFGNPCKRIKDKRSLKEKLGLNDAQFKQCLEIMDLLQYECELRAY